jgi:putative ABC transport system permease protein
MPDALDLKRRMHSAKGFAFYRATISNLSDRDRPAVVHVLETDADLFDAMGVRMAHGHQFRSDADEPGHACEVVISWSFWKTQFNGLAVDGQTIRLNDQLCVIDGVLPANLDLPVATEIWRALSFDLHQIDNGRAIRSLEGIAHLKSDVSVNTFNAELASVCNELSREHPKEDTGLRVIAVRLRDWLARDASQSVLILFAAVVGVLLMACANVANLLLARSSARLREIAVRVAVGANRLMLFRQLLTESVLLALASSLSGLLLATVAVHVLRWLPNTRIPRPESIIVDWRVMLFAIFAGGLTGMAFGVMPALRVSFASLTGELSQAGGRISETRRHQLIRKLLVGTETAIATILLIASFLLLHSLSVVLKINPGFDTSHLLTAYLSLPLTRYGKDTNDSARFAQNVVSRLRNMEGIEEATFTTNVPLQSMFGSGPVQIEGSPAPLHESDSPFALNTGISPSFRKTLKIPLLAGRDLEDRDDRDYAAAILVNATFAKLFSPHKSAVGRRLRYSPNINPNASWQEIVGVIGDTRQDGLEGVVQPELYMPLSRSISMFPAVIIRTADKPGRHLRYIENAVHQVDAEVPIFLPRTMEQVESRRVGSRTFSTALLTGFACVALLLACSGIFAVIAYSVSQRTSEIGLRVACGATQGDVLRMIIRQGLVPAFIGIAAGVTAALVVNRYLASLLYGVKPTDPFAYAGTVLLLAAVSTLACWLPALRAARLDPWRALRYE